MKLTLIVFLSILASSAGAEVIPECRIEFGERGWSNSKVYYRVYEGKRLIVAETGEEPQVDMPLKAAVTLRDKLIAQRNCTLPLAVPEKICQVEKQMGRMPTRDGRYFYQLVVVPGKSAGDRGYTDLNSLLEYRDLLVAAQFCVPGNDEL